MAHTNILEFTVKSLDLNLTKNPYNCRSSEWKAFGLGVLVCRGTIAQSKAPKYQDNSPNGLAFSRGYESVIQEALCHASS
jgi:hypothetical protein